VATLRRRISSPSGTIDDSSGPGSSDRIIRIVVAEDQGVDRAGLVLLLGTQPDLQVVGEAVTGMEAVKRCRELQPEVVILDTRMPGMDGLAAIPRLRQAAPQTRILALAERGEARCLVLHPPRPGSEWNLDGEPSCGPVSDCLQLAVARGANGAIRRSADPDDLFRAVRALAAGSQWFESGTASRMVDNALALGLADPARMLSEREREVAGMIAEGQSNKDIARRLGITVPTVKKHVGHILSKLQLQDRLQVGLHLARNPLVLMDPAENVGR
jgi:DNA-binding NarL/FixJ family response regulator